MPLVTVQNITSGSFAVPAPVSRVLRAGRSVTLSLSDADAQNPALLAAVTARAIALTVAADPNVPDTIESMPMASIRDITLVAAAEAANARVVTGQVVNGSGAAVEAAAEIYLEVITPTVGKGAVTVSTGTEKLNIVSGATNFTRCWLTTNATGGFAVSIADDIAETLLLKVVGDNGATSLLALTYA